MDHKRARRGRIGFASSLVAVMFLVHLTECGHAQTSPARDLVNQALDAMGGADALRALRGLAIKGEVRHWEPEELYSPGGPPVFTDHSTFAILWDLKAGTARTDWDRFIQFPAVTHDVYSEIVTPQRGYADVAGTELTIAQSDLPPKGQRPMSRFALPPICASSSAARLGCCSRPPKLRSGSRRCRTKRSVEGPFMVLLAACSRRFPCRPSRSRTATSRSRSCSIRQLTLPLAIRTRDDDAILGDSNYDLVLSDWRPAGGVKIAHGLTYTLDNVRIAKAQYTEVVVNPPIPDETFAFPTTVTTAGPPAAARDVPYQWVLRRLNFNRFPDSDAVNFMPGGGLRLVQLAPNVQQVVGGSHNGLIVAMKDYLVVFDAPINEWQSLFTIDAAKSKYPGKPVKYLVLTHHHIDHVGGARAYVAEGATVIVPSPDKVLFEKMFAAPHAVSPDRLQKEFKPANVVDVVDQSILRDSDGEVRLYNIANPHAEGMLIGYLPKEGILWVTDMYSPARDERKTPGAVNLYETLHRLGITPSILAGGHGGSASYAEFDGIER